MDQFSGSRSPSISEIFAKSKRAGAAIARQARLKSLQDKLQANPRDAVVRKELIDLYVVELDNPSAAAGLLADDIDEVTRTYVPLAAKNTADLPEAICMELGDWYYRTLLKGASAAGKSVVLRRAQVYYQRFLELHTKKDMRSYRVRAALANIEKELAKLGPSDTPTSPAAVKTIILDLGGGVTMKFVRIPAGKFMMGSPKTETGRAAHEGPQRQVTISKPFYMGATEVTQAQYQALMGEHNSTFKGRETPVEQVTLDDAEAFCKALSKKTRCLAGLPTEAQWEYACRAGTTTPYVFGDNVKLLGDYAWYSSTAGGRTHPVAQKKPNAFGLYDMYGNLWEWCSDRYATSYKNAKPVNPKGPVTGPYRVMRGGSWNYAPNACRSAFRGWGKPDLRYNYVGFRVVIDARRIPRSLLRTKPKPKPKPKPKVGSSGKMVILNLGKGVTMKLVRIPAGKFLMGSPASEKDREENEVQHWVTISKPFYMGVTEVTQEQYQAVTGKNPSKFRAPLNAVEMMRCSDGMAFCAALSKKTGRAVHLPTEAQWEYACRAGTKTRFSSGDDDKSLDAHGWTKANSGGMPHPVAQKKPNAWGLHDMHGNVSEWCADWYAPFTNAKTVDPKGPVSGKHRVLRGGAWRTTPKDCRTARRVGYTPVNNNYNYGFGFRVVVEVGRKLKPVPKPKVVSSGKELTLTLGKGVTMKLASISAGKFMMGSPKTETGRGDNEGPQREVTIGKSFYMGVTEVTQAQYEAVTGKNPSRFRDPTNPVERVSQKDAMAFCEALSRKTKRAVRLPTEAQWEYACRAGSKTRFAFGDDDKALGAHGWSIANSDMKTHPVAGKKPNAWGLYDMHGNVWERCADWYADSYVDAKTVDPKGPAAGKFGVLRGGSWYYKPTDCRAAARCKGNAGHRNGLDGFRVVVVPGGKLKPAGVRKKPKPLPTSKVTSSGKELALTLGKGVTMKLVRIGAGKFMMGSPKTEADRVAREGPQRLVTISKAFYMGATEVTQAQYEMVTGKNPSRFKEPQNPVEKVTWNDATAFCTALSKKTRRAVRLPTEAQWEYACRAGTKTRFSFGSGDKGFDVYGWYGSNSGAKTHPVAQKKPNAFGLYDMHGNVAEWCRDAYDEKFYAKAKNVDPENTAEAKIRVLRGGSWFSYSQYCRAAFRLAKPPVPSDNYGFRVVVTADSKR
ncbi:MAG: formylglycine-generating enzyme family protein [Phycisphaerae bacterium]|jgi:formylglycine-generating enzyme required for sulfatase activity|nr:formylglycine-generating enzyme family protein [Phycisphaerae bacterium]